MSDVFGYSGSNTKTGGVITSSNVLVKIGGQDLQLAQSANLSYSRQVRPVFSMGTDEVWMQPQQPTGTLDVRRMIGSTPALKPYEMTDICDTTTIALAKSGGLKCGTAEFGTVTCQQAMLSDIGLQIDVSSFSVVDSARWTVGFVSLG